MTNGTAKTPPVPQPSSRRPSSSSRQSTTPSRNPSAIQGRSERGARGGRRYSSAPSSRASRPAIHNAAHSTTRVKAGPPTSPSRPEESPVQARRMSGSCSSGPPAGKATSAARMRTTAIWLRWRDSARDPALVAGTRATRSATRRGACSSDRCCRPARYRNPAIASTAPSVSHLAAVTMARKPIQKPPGASNPCTTTAVRRFSASSTPRTSRAMRPGRSRGRSCG
jgi:hypothetical protein